MSQVEQIERIFLLKCHIMSIFLNTVRAGVVEHIPPFVVPWENNKAYWDVSEEVHEQIYMMIVEPIYWRLENKIKEGSVGLGCVG